MAELAADEEAFGVFRAVDDALSVLGWDADAERWTAAVDGAFETVPPNARRPPELFLLCRHAYQAVHLAVDYGVDPDRPAVLFARIARRGNGLSARICRGLRPGLSVLGALALSPRTQSTVVATLIAMGAHVDVEGQAARAAALSAAMQSAHWDHDLSRRLSPLARYAAVVTVAQPSKSGDLQLYRFVLHAFMRGRGADTPEFALDAERCAAKFEPSVPWRGRATWARDEVGVTRPLRAVAQVRAVVHAARRRLPRELVRMCANFMGLGLYPRAPVHTRHM